MAKIEQLDVSFEPLNLLRVVSRTSSAKMEGLYDAHAVDTAGMSQRDLNDFDLSVS